MMSVLFHDVARTLRIAAAVSISLLFGLFLVSYAETFIDKKIYRARVSDAVANGVLIERAPFFVTGAPYRHMQNDCLILAMLATKGPGSRMQRTLSPATPALAPPADYKSIGYDQSRNEPIEQAKVRGTPRAEHCYLTKVSLARNPAAVSYYHRYIHGYWIVAGGLIAVFPFATASLLLFLVPVLISVFTLSWSAISNYRTKLNQRDTAYSVLAFGYLTLSGVTFFAWSMDLALAETALVSFIFFAYCNPLNHLCDRAIVLTSSMFGSLCVSFEFLTGLIPSALTLMIGLIALEHSIARVNATRRSMLAVGGFITAVICTLGLKTAAVALLFGSDEIISFASLFARHLASDQWQVSPSTAQALAQVGVLPEQVKDVRILGYFFALAKLAYFSDLLTFGLRPLGILVVTVGPFVLLVSATIKALRNRGYERANLLLFLASAGVPYIWTYVMLNHTIINSVWMQRMFVWPTLIGLALLAANVLFSKRSKRGRGHEVR